MKIIKIALGVVAAGVALLLIVVAVIAARFDPNSYKAELTALVKDKTGRTLTLDGPLSLSFFPKLAVKAEKIALSGAGGKGDFARVGELRLSLALLPLLSQRVVVDRVALTGVSAEVVRYKNGRTSIDDLTGGGDKDSKDRDSKDKQDSKDAKAPPVALDVAGVDIAIDSLAWRDEGSGGQWKLSGLKLGTGRIADDAPGKLSLASRIEGAAMKADINLASAYRFNFSKQTASLSDLSLKIAGDLPSMKGAKLAVDGQVETDWGREKAGGTLTVKFDESTIKAKFDVQGFSPAAISFDADIDKLNVDRYLSPAGGSDKGGDKGGGKAEGKSQAAAEQPLDLEGLKALNLKGQLRVGQLSAARLKMEKVQLGMNAKGGRVDLNPIAASLYGGTLAGAASINANSYQFTAKQQLSGINIGPLLRDVAEKDLLEGRGKVVVDVQTTGRTVSALKKALGGSASVELADGALKGINLAESLRKAKAAAVSITGSKSAQEQAASQVGKSGDKTDFSELTASFVIKNGVASNNDLSMKAPFVRLGGAGDLDIGENRMNYLAKAAVVNTSAGQGGKELESLAGLTVPVRVSGPFEALSYRIEIGSMVSDTVKQKVQESVKSTVQDRLKGLFGR